MVKIGILVAGQSNTLGVNGPRISEEGVPPIDPFQAILKKSDLVSDDAPESAPGQVDEPVSGIRMLSRGALGAGTGTLPYVVAPAGTFQQASMPLQQDDVWKESTCFAFQLCKQLKIKLGPSDELFIVHAGLGATAVGDGNPFGNWYPNRRVPGTFPPPNGLNRYTRLLQFVQDAKLQEPSLRWGGMLWHQGEADAGTSYKDYWTELAYVFSTLRRDVGEPNLPIVVGTMHAYWQQLGPGVHRTHVHGPSWMRNVQVARMDDVNFPDDPQLNPYMLNDRTHISRDGHRVMAPRYLEALLSLTTAPVFSVHPATASSSSWPVSSQQPLRIPGIVPGATYQVSVAVTNAQGTGPSSSVTTVTPTTPPAAPVHLMVTQTPASGTLFLEWSPALSVEGGAAFVRYDIEVVPSVGPSSVVAVTTRLPADRLVTGLTDGAMYTFRVRVVHGSSISPYSATTPAIRPGVPGPCSGVGATPGHGSAVNPALYSALVAYFPPTNVVSENIVEYEATSSPGGLKGVVTRGGFILMRGLTAGVSYTFTVRARNAAGYGPPSAPSNPVVPLTTIAAPGIPQAVGVTLAGQTATLTITPPTSDGGSPIASYRIEAIGINNIVNNGVVTVSGGTIIQVPDLFVSETYIFIVWALNAAGYGVAFQTPNVGPVTLSPPSAPTSVVAANLGGGRAQVSFTPSSTLGGATRVYYTATSSVGGIFADGRASPIVVSGLSVGSQTFMVRATNGGGYVGTPISTRSATSASSAPIVISV